MLAQPARQRILSDVHEDIGPDYPSKATFWLPVSHPDINERGYQPYVRWQHEDIPEPTPPYELVVFELGPTGVEINGQPMNYTIGVDSDGTDQYAVHKGARVYDQLNIKVVARGVDEVDDPDIDHVHDESDRAAGIARALYKYFREDFDQSVGLGPYRPPVRAEVMGGRGVTNVTAEMDRQGTQYDAGVQLHYVDDWYDALESATDAEITTDIRTADGTLLR